MNDDSCLRCSRVSYAVPSTAACQSYSIREGCYGNTACTGRFRVFGVSSTSVNGAPTASLPPNGASPRPSARTNTGTIAPSRRGVTMTPSLRPRSTLSPRPTQRGQSNRPTSRVPPPSVVSAPTRQPPTGIPPFIPTSLQWTWRRSGATNNYYTSLAASGSGLVMGATASFYGGSGGIFLSSNAGTSWRRAQGNTIYYIIYIIYIIMCTVIYNLLCKSI